MRAITCVQCGESISTGFLVVQGRYYHRKCMREEDNCDEKRRRLFKHGNGDIIIAKFSGTTDDVEWGVQKDSGLKTCFSSKDRFLEYMKESGFKEEEVEAE
jgi:hypothetical protein